MHLKDDPAAAERQLRFTEEKTEAQPGSEPGLSKPRGLSSDSPPFHSVAQVT